MSTLIVHLNVACLLLAAATVTFRFVFRRDHERTGRLSPLAIVSSTLIWFALGGFPILYLPRHWPAVYADPLMGMLEKMALGGGLAILLLSVAQRGLRRALGQRQNALGQKGFHGLSRNPQILGCALG